VSRNFLLAALAGIALLISPGIAKTKSKKKAAAPGPAPFHHPVGVEPLSGMPALIDPHDLYAADRPNALSPTVQKFPSRVYVPNSGSNTVDVIDPKTYKIVDHFDVGKQPQHVVPSWDLKTLWVLNDLGNSLTKIDPLSGKKGETVPVEDPYNMYYTPDGKYAMVVAEAKARLDFRDPVTLKLITSVPVPCKGVDHVDFSPHGRYLLASCEFSGKIVKVDIKEKKVAGLLPLGSRRAMPQDVKLSPDGKTWYVADMMSNGVFLIDGDNLKVISFLLTGKGAHGLYVSRDSKSLYVSNRSEGSVSVIDFATRKIVHTWRIPGGGSPDMGGVSADGKVLWLAGRWHSEVYAISTEDGRLLAKVPVGKGPHGLCVYPQPGRYSLGHTGIFR